MRNVFDKAGRLAPIAAGAMFAALAFSSCSQDSGPAPKVGAVAC